MSLRDKVYPGKCLRCGKTSVRVSYDYDPKMKTFEVDKECLKCGGSEGIELTKKALEDSLEDLQSWLRRVDFSEEVSPKVEMKIWEEGERKKEEEEWKW